MSRTMVKHYIDRKLRDIFKNGFDNEPTETKVKVIAQAIAWERAKAQIKDKEHEEGFDPDKL